MKNNETIRELLSGCRTAARALNIILGVDFQRSFDAATIKGRYTVNQVIKTAAAALDYPRTERKTAASAILPVKSAKKQLKHF